MTKLIEVRILLEEFSDMARQGTIFEFIEVIKNNCSVMLFDQKNLSYKLLFKDEYWANSLKQFPGIEKYYLGIEHNE